MAGRPVNRQLAEARDEMLLKTNCSVSLFRQSGNKMGPNKMGPLRDNDSQPGAPHLQPRAFTPLPLGSISPRGWLLDQCRIQADGITGHLEEFWPDLGPDNMW